MYEHDFLEHAGISFVIKNYSFLMVHFFLLIFYVKTLLNYKGVMGALKIKGKIFFVKKMKLVNVKKGGKSVERALIYFPSLKS